MGVNLVVAVTDGEWFNFLREKPDLTEVDSTATSLASTRTIGSMSPSAF
jgi:hypothetical protein